MTFKYSNGFCLLKIPVFFLLLLLLLPLHKSRISKGSFFLSSQKELVLQFFFMASFVISMFSSSSFALSCKSYRPYHSPTVFSRKPISTKAYSASLDYSTPSSVIDQNPLNPFKTNCWEWKSKDNVIHIYYEEHMKESTDPPKNLLMIPTISDVSTVEEWRAVAKVILGRPGTVNWRAIIVDWPGLGYSSRPKMDYDADMLEKFVVDFINEISSPENDLVVFGGGHAATIAVRAAKKGLVKPKAIAAVAPTWAGPLPIVFGRHPNMQTRYGLLRGTLRAPAIGWMMYNMLVSNEGAIQSQYRSHVYANPKNVTPEIVQRSYKLTTKKGSRYVPAAFLTGLLDPVNSREEFLELFSNLEGKVPVLVVSTEGSPKRSKVEMEALREAKGVSKFVEVPGALLPQEEYPTMVANELYQFLQENFEVNA